MSVEEFFDTTAERYDRRYDDRGARGRLLRRRLEVAVELLGEPRGRCSTSAWAPAGSAPSSTAEAGR